jgi:hypothetical protein
MDEKLKQEIKEYLKESLRINLSYTDTFRNGKNLKVTLYLDDEEITSYEEGLCGL